MAAAIDVVDAMTATPIRSKNVRQRERASVGGTRGTESFGRDEEERRRKAKRNPNRLVLVELEELRDLWGMYDSAIGQRSVHGAVEARLLRAPPRDEARSDVVDELARAGGRMPEGALLRIVAAERGSATTYEVRRALHMLVMSGRVERVASEAPHVPESTSEKPERHHLGIDNLQMQLAPERLTRAQREWTGFDVRLTKAEEAKAERGGITMRTALRSTGNVDAIAAVHAECDAYYRSKETQERRLARKLQAWQRQDEAIERSWRELYCADDQRGAYASVDVRDVLTPRQRASMQRASASLALILPTQRAVIRRYYCDNADPFALHRQGWKLAGDDVLCVAEFTELAGAAARAVSAPSIVSLLRRRETEDIWIAQLRKASHQLVDSSSLAYRQARQAVGAS